MNDGDEQRDAENRSISPGGDARPDAGHGVADDDELRRLDVDGLRRGVRPSRGACTDPGRRARPAFPQTLACGSEEHES